MYDVGTAEYETAKARKRSRVRRHERRTCFAPYLNQIIEQIALNAMKRAIQRCGDRISSAHGDQLLVAKKGKEACESDSCHTQINRPPEGRIQALIQALSMYSVENRRFGRLAYLFISGGSARIPRYVYSASHWLGQTPSLHVTPHPSQNNTTTDPSSDPWRRSCKISTLPAIAFHPTVFTISQSTRHQQVAIPASRPSDEGIEHSCYPPQEVNLARIA